MDLDSRVTVIEENGNLTISVLERRVDTLEETATDHETRISTTESDINGKWFSNSSFLNFLENYIFLSEKFSFRFRSRYF